MGSLWLPFDSKKRPLVTARVEPSDTQQRLFYNSARPPIPVPYVPCTCLLDTGSNASLIEEPLLDGWNLPRRDPVIVSSSEFGDVQAFLYDLSLKLHVQPQQPVWHVKDFAVRGVPKGYFGANNTFNCLLGTDLLELGYLHYRGVMGSCELAWP